MSHIVGVVGVDMSAKAIAAKAQESVKGMLSIRGIEKFAMDCARQRVREDVARQGNGSF